MTFKTKRRIMWIFGLTMIAGMVWFIVTPVNWVVGGRTILYEPDYNTMYTKARPQENRFRAALKRLLNKGKLVTQSKILSVSLSDNPEHFGRKDAWGGTLKVTNIGQTPITFNPFHEPRLIILEDGRIVPRQIMENKADARAGRSGVTLKPGESYKIRRTLMFKRSPDGEFILFTPNERYKIRTPGKIEFVYVMKDAASSKRTIAFDLDNSAEAAVYESSGDSKFDFELLDQRLDLAMPMEALDPPSTYVERAVEEKHGGRDRE